MPEEKNSSVLIDKILSRFPTLKFNPTSPENPKYERSWALPDHMPWEEADWAGEFVGQNAAAIQMARQLVNFPDGQLNINYAPGIIGTILNKQQNYLQIGPLLRWDARVEMQLGHLDVAIEDIRALINFGRTFNREEGLIFLGFRRYQQLQAAELVEELLALSEPQGQTFAILQEELLRESQEDLYLPALRFERAMSFEAMNYFAKEVREGRMMQIFAQYGIRLPTVDLRVYLIPYRYGAFAKGDQAAYLREITDFIEECKKPEYELTEVQKSYNLRHAIINRWPDYEMRSLMGNVCLFKKVEFLVADLKAKALLRCAATAIAVERYRQDHKRWPENLDQLVPQYLKSVPRDPFIDAPLKLRRVEDGIVLYSVGENGQDDQGDVVKPLNSTVEPADLGVKIWNSDRRGRANKD
jgi:hypothetical protein